MLHMHDVMCGVLVNVHMPKDRISQTHQGYGFIEFLGEEDADYAIRIMNMIKLYGKPVRVNKVWMLASLSSNTCRQIRVFNTLLYV